MVSDHRDHISSAHDVFGLITATLLLLGEHPQANLPSQRASAGVDIFKRDLQPFNKRRLMVLWPHNADRKAILAPTLDGPLGFVRSKIAGTDNLKVEDARTQYCQQGYALNR
jgi:hypothetical protein